MPASKASLRDQLVAVLAADLSTRRQAYKTALEAATHEEAKPENDKDTRALEQSYLARGEAARIGELAAAIAELQALDVRPARPGDPAVVGALVTADEGGAPLRLWIAPHGGGVRLDEGRVQVVTPRSPLGQALVGKRPGDECELLLAGRTRALTVVAVD